MAQRAVSRVFTAQRAASSAASTSKQRFELLEKDATFPKGYVATGLHCGVKKDPSVYDLGIVLSTREASAAACFTRNAFQAAPVTVSKEVLAKQKGKARAIVVNSGCANAVTGSLGMEHARQMSAALSKNGSENALVLSTGVIGQHLPIRRILGGLEAGQATLSSSFASWQALSRAFMTTDTFPKMRTKSFEIDGQEYRFVGIDKGAGMIHPNMGPPHATLLGLIATDAPVEPSALQSALTHAVDRSFNSISVDGDMSTNDTIIALANGASGGEEIQQSTPAFETFQAELTAFAIELASLIVRDGEGATKFIRVLVEGAPTFEGAKHIASTVSTSSLVKTALYGQDANWGRILCAVGYSQPDFTIDPTKVSVSFVPTDGSETLELLVNGEPAKVDEARASEILKSEDLEIRINLGLGSESASYYTCDLSHEYISIKQRGLPLMTIVDVYWMSLYSYGCIQAYLILTSHRRLAQTASAQRPCEQRGGSSSHLNGQESSCVASDRLMSGPSPIARPSSAPAPLSGSGGPLQEAPYLTHRTRYDGRLTLIPADNHGRTRKPDKPRKRGKYEVPDEVRQAVARAGLPASSPALAATPPAPASGDVSRSESPVTARAPRARRRRQGIASAHASNLSLPLIERGTSQASVTESFASVSEAPPEQSESAEARDEGATASRRIDIWAGIAEAEGEPPPVWSAPDRPPPIPSSPPPDYDSPSPSSRASSPDTAVCAPTEAQRLWEADREAGYTLTERLERERLRRHDSLQALQDVVDAGARAAEAPRLQDFVPVRLFLAPPAVIVDEPVEEEAPTSPNAVLDGTQTEERRILPPPSEVLPAQPIAEPEPAEVAAIIAEQEPLAAPLPPPTPPRPSLKSQLLASPPSNRIMDRPRPRFGSRTPSTSSLAARTEPQASTSAVTLDDDSVPSTAAAAAAAAAAPSEPPPLPKRAGERPLPSTRSLESVLPTAPAPLFPARPAPSSNQLFTSRFAVPPKVAPNLPGEQWRTSEQLEAAEPSRPMPSWEQKWQAQAEWDEDTPLVGPSTRTFDPELRRRREGHRASLILTRPISVRRKPPPVPPPRRSWVPPLVITEEESYASRSADESSSVASPPARPMSSSLAYIPPSEAASLPEPIAPTPTRANVTSIVDRFEAASRVRPPRRAPPPPPPPPLSSRPAVEEPAAKERPLTQPVSIPEQPRRRRSLPRPPTDAPSMPPRPPAHVLAELNARAVGAAPSTAVPVLVEGSNDADAPNDSASGENGTEEGEQEAGVEQEQPVEPFSQWTDLDLLAARHTADRAPGADPPAESSYEPLLLLGEVLGPAPARPSDAEKSRVSQAKIELVRRRVRADGKVMLRMACVGISVSRCTICQVQFRDQDPAAIFPGCLHVFHLGCLESWLNRSRACPVCRKDIAAED